MPIADQYNQLKNDWTKEKLTRNKITVNAGKKHKKLKKFRIHECSLVVNSSLCWTLVKPIYFEVKDEEMMYYPLYNVLRLCWMLKINKPENFQNLYSTTDTDSTNQEKLYNDTY